MNYKQFHRNFKIGVGLWRSGQIKTGIMGSRNENDEKFIKFISRMGTAKKIFRLSLIDSEQTIDKLSIINVFDCRPWKNAMGNKFIGKGYLQTKNYELTHRHFGNIDNIHEMRDSLNAVLAGFLGGENETALVRWYGHIKKIIDGATVCATWLSKGHNVIVNCSDGWDRTPQVCSTTKIRLNPLFRTFKGFQTLICYEWIGFGH